MGTPSAEGLIARRPLADGLVLRTATPEDAAELAEFNAVQQAEDDLPGDLVHEWTLELFENPPPRFRAEDDVVVVEDTATGRIVSSVLLIPQDWSYARRRRTRRPAGAGRPPTRPTGGGASSGSSSPTSTAGARPSATSGR